MTHYVKQVTAVAIYEAKDKTFENMYTCRKHRAQDALTRDTVLLGVCGKNIIICGSRSGRTGP